MIKYCEEWPFGLGMFARTLLRHFDIITHCRVEQLATDGDGNIVTAGRHIKDTVATTIYSALMTKYDTIIHHAAEYSLDG